MNDRTRARARGYTLLESLVILVILAIAVTIGLAMVQERLSTARARVAAQQLAVDLRAARFTAVSSRSPVELVVEEDPANRYEYTDVRGRTRSIELPQPVRIVSATSPIQFQPNGTLPAGVSIVLEIEVGDDEIERWTITAGTMGVPHVEHEREGA